VRIRDVTALQVQGQLEDAVVHQFAAVANKKFGIVGEQVVVSLDRSL
jgi:hypothetical protein